jgi:hypothetical protein
VNCTSFRKIQRASAGAPHPRPFPHKLRGGRENFIPVHEVHRAVPQEKTGLTRRARRTRRTDNPLSFLRVLPGETSFQERDAPGFAAVTVLSLPHEKVAVRAGGGKIGARSLRCRHPPCLHRPCRCHAAPGAALPPTGFRFPAGCGPCGRSSPSSSACAATAAAGGGSAADRLEDPPHPSPFAESTKDGPHAEGAEDAEKDRALSASSASSA